MERIFSKEVSFAMSELHKMKKQDSSINIRHLLEINMYIFKENLKIILQQTFEQFWTVFSQKENLDQILIQSVYSNGVITIPEEEYKSGLSSYMSSQGNLRANVSDLSDQSKVDRSGNFISKSILEAEDPEKKFQINFPNLSHIQLQNQDQEELQCINSSPRKRLED